MKTVELKDETFQEFQERCKWHVIPQNCLCDGFCKKGEKGVSEYESSFITICAEIYCPRLKKRS